jgi:hypothetical protein
MEQAIEGGKMNKGDDVMLIKFGVRYLWRGCMLKYGGDS